jgi:phenylalanyl-tRNA synthetase beta chain
VNVTGDGWEVVPPSRRFDIAIEEDLIEEVARIHGYDAIPTTLPAGAARIAVPSETLAGEDELRAQMAARGYFEAVNFAFVDEGLLRTWQAHEGGVPLANPLSAELGVMRTRLLPGLVAAAARNLSRQQSRVRLFELGKVFAASTDGEAPLETPRIAAVVQGGAQVEQWGAAVRTVDFHDLKGDLDALAACTGARLDYRPSAAPHGHPGRSAEVVRVDGDAPRRLGWIGELHPRLLRALDLEGTVLAFELDLEPLRMRAVPRAAALSRYPSVRRDLAFVAPEGVPWSALEATVRQAAGPLLAELRLFDRYVGKGVDPGFRSLATGLILQDNSRTLAEGDVDVVVAAVIAALQHEHGARIRS